MKIPPGSPSLPKVFALATPRHLLAKLHWEIAGFANAEKDRCALGAHLIAAYHAMNCAITTWHMADWVWNYLDDKSRQQISNALSLKKVDQASFEAHIRAECRAINCCRDIATGSKHMKITRGGADPSVVAEVSWSYEQARAGVMRAGDPLGRYEARLIVHDQHGQRSAREVFSEAFAYWEALLSRFGLIEDKYIESGAG